ncbi:MAG: mammalian cell entry protein [Mycobacterium sp.]|nr:mammalian cell entry protein [Mycobacterium sp.]
MSPRRRITPDDMVLWEPVPPAPPLRRLSLVTAVGSVVLVAALTVSCWVFVHAQSERRTEIKRAAVLSFVSSFITHYTSPDPFNANDYADKVLALGTGNFAAMYSERMNEVVIQVARAERGIGAVQELGIENWNDDGSANVLAVTTMTTTMPDGKKIETGSRWVVTAIKEGEQWKVSDLIQVL